MKSQSEKGGDLPRERAVKYGIKSLSDPELLAILLGSGTRGMNVFDLSRHIMESCGWHLSRLAEMSCTAMTGSFHGLGPAKAVSLQAALELGSRAAADRAAVALQRTAITRASDTVALVRHRFDGLDHEEFWVLVLNNALKVLDHRRVSTGGVTATVVDIKTLMRKVLEIQGASALIMYHNHPSGNPRPSPQDDTLTRRIRDAAATLDLRLLDHIIVTDDSHYSYNDNQRLQ